MTVLTVKALNQALAKARLLEHKGDLYLEIRNIPFFEYLKDRDLIREVKPGQWDLV